MKTNRVNIVTSIVSVEQEMSSETERLLIEAQTSAKRAYAPYSNFKVGVALLLSNGKIISANNQENAAYPSGLCAERVALFFANANYPQESVTHLLIYAETEYGAVKTPITPCGACRQVLIEKERNQKEPIKIYLVGAEVMYTVDSASQLMPLSFTSDSLNG